jgi:hypothetical protein
MAATAVSRNTGARDNWMPCVTALASAEKNMVALTGLG